MAVKSLKMVGKQLSEMGRELDRIAEISNANAGPLHSKLDEAEQMKIQIETELLERVHTCIHIIKPLLFVSSCVYDDVIQKIIDSEFILVLLEKSWSIF